MNLALLNTAITASIEAGKEILKIYALDFDVETKDDSSPLTIADKNANDVINSYLENTPFPIISEENKQTDYVVRKDWETCWIVDPLDGTKEFVKRNGEFTVNIALITNGRPVLGVIYVPVTKEVFFTASDMTTSYVCIIDEDHYDVGSILQKAKQISPAALDEAAMVNIVGSRSHLNADTEAFVNRIKETSEVTIVSKGSSLKFCLVAEGKAHLYPRYAPTMEWDTAAGQAICEAVGVQVIDKTTNLPLQYNKENLLNPYFLVTP